eukprot:6498643-Prymnesium_polylepis.1
MFECDHERAVAFAAVGGGARERTGTLLARSIRERGHEEVIGRRTLRTLAANVEEDGTAVAAPVAAVDVVPLRPACRRAGDATKVVEDGLLVEVRRRVGRSRQGREHVLDVVAAVREAAVRQAEEQREQHCARCLRRSRPLLARRFFASFACLLPFLRDFLPRARRVPHARKQLLGEPLCAATAMHPSASAACPPPATRPPSPPSAPPCARQDAASAPSPPCRLVGHAR